VAVPAAGRRAPGQPARCGYRGPGRAARVCLGDRRRDHTSPGDGERRGRGLDSGPGGPGRTGQDRSLPGPGS